MKYDFEKVINRSNMGSSKWEQMKKWNPHVAEDIVPFSVADMEFVNPPEIIEGLKQLLDTAVLGYTRPTLSYYKAVCGWMKRRHHWHVEPEWIIESSGVVSAFYAAVRAFSEPGDGVIIMPPVYHPFFSAISVNNRTKVECPLINTGSSYQIDFDKFESLASKPENKLFLFCSPHNPVGRVWTKDELTRLGEICLRHDVLILSDEIHFDLIMPGYEHTVFATLSDELANKMVVFTAPSKTFNIAGLQASNVIIPNKNLREAYSRELHASGFFQLNIMAYKACEIAYTQCEEWLDQLIKVIYHNHLTLKKYIEENLPLIKVYGLEGTYLQWMDFNGLGLDKECLEDLMHRDALIFFNEGYIFGEGGSGFERMNIACPTSVLVKALDRLHQTVRKLEL